MAQKKLDTFNMETRFDGLIKLLAEGLYSEKDIFVRELIQNAHDSIIRRKATEPNLAGRIDVHYDTAQQTIAFIDNEFHQNLSDGLLYKEIADMLFGFHVLIKAKDPTIYLNRIALMRLLKMRLYIIIGYIELHQ